MSSTSTSSSMANVNGNDLIVGGVISNTTTTGTHTMSSTEESNTQSQSHSTFDSPTAYTHATTTNSTIEGVHPTMTNAGTATNGSTTTTVIQGSDDNDGAVVVPLVPTLLPTSPPLSPSTAGELPSRVETTTTKGLMASSNIPTSPTTPIRTGKRPSPWREPRTTGRPPPPAREATVSSSAVTTSKKTTGSNHHRQDHDDMVLQPTLNEEQVRKKMRTLQKKKERRWKYLCSGSIVVNIPISVTADLGIALRRGREHRIKALHRHFPSLQQGLDLDGKDDDLDRDDRSSTAGTTTRDSGTNDDSPNKTKDIAHTKKVLRHVPQPHEYENVIDYLEAKYVQGVVISDDLDDYGNGDTNHDNQADDDDDEGEGSIYSETSFLDDTGLQRTIAEQVLGHTTTTKLELMSQDDGGFFVNVGDLEVEETDLTQDMYDPIDDTKKDSLKTKKSRKRKASINGNDTTLERKSIGSSIGDKKKSQKLVANEKASSTTAPIIKPTSPSTNKKPKVEEKKQEPISPTIPSMKKPSLPKAESIAHKNPVTMKLQKISTRKKEEIMEHFNKLKVIIDSLTDDELPRKPKPKRTRVVVKVPTGNKPGDMITFANPHVPGQKLKVKVPVNIKAGETFKVTVPKPAEDDNDDDNLGEDGLIRDHNKFNREFYDVLDDYAKTFDDWCDAEGAYRRAIDDKTFTSHFMKRNKCDDLISLFPKDTKTSISIEYLKKVIRRARQNKHKRELTLAKQQISFIEEHQDLIEQNSDNDDGDGKNNDEDDEDVNNDSNIRDSSDDDEDEKGLTSVPIKSTSSAKVAVAVTKKGIKPTRTAILPDFSHIFPKFSFSRNDFMEVTS